MAEPFSEATQALLDRARAQLTGPSHCAKPRVRAFATSGAKASKPRCASIVNAP